MLLFEKELQECDAGAVYRDCYRGQSSQGVVEK